eukprot:2477814-Rhodomonas_salina.3
MASSAASLCTSARARIYSAHAALICTPVCLSVFVCARACANLFQAAHINARICIQMLHAASHRVPPHALCDALR